MKIAFFTGSTRHGGIGRVCAQMSWIWANDGHEVLLFSEDEPMPSEYSFSYAHREVVKQGRIGKRELSQLLERTCFDVAVINGRVIGRGFETVLRSLKALDVPVISVIHHSFATWLYLLIGNDEYLAKPYLHLIDCLVCVDPLQAIWWKMMGANGLYIANPVAFKPAGNYCERKGNVLIWIGRAEDKGKRLDFMMRVFAKVLDKNPKAELVVLGDIKADVRNQFLKEYGNDVYSRVRNPGFVLNVEEYLKNADLHVFTSILEVTVPQVVLEAQMVGLPSVVMDMPVFCDVGEEEGIVKCQTENAFTEAIVDLLDNRIRLNKIGDAALNAGFRKMMSRETETKWHELLSAIHDKARLGNYLKKEFEVIDTKRHRDALISEIQRAFAYFCENHFRKLRLPVSLRCRAARFLRKHLCNLPIFRRIYELRDAR